MCLIEEFISSTGCGHTVDVFTRCADAVKAGELQCDPTFVYKSASLNDSICASCAAAKIKGVAEAPPSVSRKTNQAKDLFTKLFCTQTDLVLNVSEPSRQRPSPKKRAREQQGTTCQRSEGRRDRNKKGRTHVDDPRRSCEQDATELDYGDQDAKENIKPRA
ncbi:hypothetical protein TWF730_011250 [Orbilia blumenaviensis]|uniref:Uncharacterized protein n=1 Tax=Orbilia blumenaviensis TaxID=1796055 RepID=A0AAV9UKZ2_9PEZI